jgi:hypothetical protein
VSNRKEATMTNRLRKLLLPTLLSAAVALAQPPGNFDLHGALMNLADQPASHTAFSFDRTELQIAQNLLLSGGLDANRAAAALTGISVDYYHYPRPAFYTPETMASIIAGYHAAGSISSTPTRPPPTPPSLIPPSPTSGSALPALTSPASPSSPAPHRR